MRVLLCCVLCTWITLTSRISCDHCYHYTEKCARRDIALKDNTKHSYNCGKINMRIIRIKRDYRSAYHIIIPAFVVLCMRAGANTVLSECRMLSAVRVSYAKRCEVCRAVLSVLTHLPCCLVMFCPSVQLYCFYSFANPTTSIQDALYYTHIPSFTALTIIHSTHLYTETIGIVEI